MNKTKIEWADYVWNPVIGCKRGCSYCYAKKINDRFHYIKDFSEPEWRTNAYSSNAPKKPSRIFVNSMSDICYWTDYQLTMVLKRIGYYPQHTFIFLTKDSSVYLRYDFPENCWLGISFDAENYTLGNIDEVYDKNRGNILFVSIEPLLNYINPNLIPELDWLIIGGLSPKPCHKQEWVEEIIEVAEGAEMPVFLKNNLHYPIKRQEFPK